MSGPGQGIIVLESSDDDRIPTEEEVNEYAEFLGLDPKTESHLMWIARNGVIAPVPPPWKACTENGDDVFYFNFDTGESVWDHPSDATFRALVEEHRAKGPEACEETADKGSLAKARGGLLESLGGLAPDTGSPLPPVGIQGRSSTQLGAVDGLGVDGLSEDAERKRLDLIMKEISDEDISESSQLSPRDAATPTGTGSPAAKADEGAGPTTSPAKSPGSAKVGITMGLAASPYSLDKSADEDRSHNSSQSSPLAASGSGAPSQSGASSKKTSAKGGSGSNASAEAKAEKALDRSGHSDCQKSSNLSEVSEDFPSDFDQSDVLSPNIGGQRTPCGDSLEVSATMEDGALPPLGAVNTSGASTEQRGNTIPAKSRAERIEGDLASLTRMLSKLREIRGQQSEYLKLLQAGG